MQKLFRFSTFKSLYGQAGSVNFNLVNGLHQVNLSTHWEDNCEYSCDPELNFTFEDNNNKSQLTNTQSGNYTVNINMPEYYGYNGNINGNLKHKSTNIDAKLYGNIDIKLTGSFEAEKIKSEVCNIKAKSLNINSSLETQLGELNIDTNIKIKKLLTSKQVIIKQKSGYLNIITAYVQQKQRNYPILIKQKFQDYITQNNHVKLITNANDIKIGTFSGLLEGNVKGKSLFIKSLSGVFNISQLENIELGITNQQCQGYIKGSRITLNIFDQLKLNVLKNGISLQDFDDSLYSIYTECDELIVRNINNPFGII